MEQVHELLDQLVLALAGNLTTRWTSAEDRSGLMNARDLGNRIQSALMSAREISVQLSATLRSESFPTGVDTAFLRTARIKLKHIFDDRIEMSRIYAQLPYAHRLSQSSFVQLKNLHGNESISLENLVYDLILQMKLWALMDMEQNQANMEQTLNDLESLMENAENMEFDQLKSEVDKLMDQLMKEMSEMMRKAAEQMDLSIQEFMNQEAMKQNQQELNDLKKQLEEALKAGDMEKAKQILEAMKQAMEAMMSSMKETIGEMSPEMKKMMEAMREMMGLIQALKENEQKLESDTQELRREIDKKIAEQMPQMSQDMKDLFKEIIDKILKLLQQTHTLMTARDFDGWTKPVFDRIGELDVRAKDDPALFRQSDYRKERRRLQRDLQFISSNGIDQFQTMLLQAINKTTLLGELLDQFEFFKALEHAQRLKGDFFRIESVADMELPLNMEKEVGAAEKLRNAGEELQKIIDFLEKMRQMKDNLRAQELQKNQDGEAQKLEKRQNAIEQMIPDFMKKYEEALKQSPMIGQLKSVQHDMDKAGKRLGRNRIGKGLKYEQDALRKLGELEEQMQQMQQGQGKPMLPMPQRPGGGQTSQMGDPTGKLFIPDAERRARKSALKDKILKKLQENLPENHSKEIKAYYERLMDQ